VNASLIARIAGNVASGLVAKYAPDRHELLAKEAISVAMSILYETDRITKEWEMAYPKKWKTVFVVKGTGEFPLDMLRYTESFPKHESEARGLTMTVNDDISIITTPRTVTLVKYHADRQPQLAEERWASFGWKVDHVVETEKL
jgi:hypothetical protein